MLGGFFLGIMTVVGGVVLFLIAQPLLLAVFSDQLSERVERDVLGKAHTVPFLTSTGRALVHGLLKLVLYGIALVVGLGLTAVTGGLGSLIGIALGGLSLAYDGFDYPLARRGASFGAKWAFLARHPGADARLRDRRHCSLSDSVRSLRRLAVRGRGCHVGVHRHRRKSDGSRAPAARDLRKKAANVAANS